MSRSSDASPEVRIARVRPFSRLLEIERVEGVGAEFAHSGTAFFVTTRDGRRYKLRDCGRRRRAADIERWIRALPDVVPRLVAREERYLLLEALNDHRLVTRTELVQQAEYLGRMTALAHRAGRALLRGPLTGLRRGAIAALSHRRFFRDLALLRRREILPEDSCDGAERKYRAHRARFGLPIDLELDDFHKGNVMIRESDGDLRYVDEEGVALRPRGTGMASLLKTATRMQTLRLYRRGYAEIADPAFITPDYVEYLLLMDAVRRVAFKVRTEGRLEKLPREVAELREMTDTPDLALEWRFPKGKRRSLDYPAAEEEPPLRAAVMRDRRIVVDDVPDPEPADGQVLVKTLACGICGSDLHALQHADQMMEVAAEAGLPESMDLARDVVMGHEFCAEVLDFGPNTLRNLKVGDRVCSMPVVFHPGGAGPVGYSNDFPGGYGERMVLTEPLLLPVPDDLPTEAATLTEPMAVGLHAVAKSSLAAGDAPLVVGCGPVGLAVIAGLRLAGAEPIVAADFSPKRRALARQMGAHVVVDPAERPAVEAWREEAAARPAVIFECVGVPGLLHEVMRDAPPGARVVVAGVCMEADRIRPLIGIYKELNLQFVLGYTPEEFAETLRAIADGRIDVRPLVTGVVGLQGVAGAFDDLGRPEEHAKILVEPWREG